MAIPQASFTFVTNGLTAFFKDTSTNVPTSWAWDFGDGNTSNVQNPNHTYAASGTYTVQLDATNADGTNSYSYDINIDEANSISTDDIITFEVPASILVDPNAKNYLLTKWRLYLQSAFEIETEYLMDESKYSQLQVILIAKLVVYDLILKEATNYMASAMNGGGNSSGGSSGGNIKKIETGPSNVEWYSGSATLSQFFSKSEGGVSAFDELTSDICGLGNRLKVKLPMCKTYSVDPIVPIKTDVEKYLTSTDYLNEHYGNS